VTLLLALSAPPVSAGRKTCDICRTTWTGASDLRARNMDSKLKLVKCAMKDECKFTDPKGQKRTAKCCTKTEIIIREVDGTTQSGKRICISRQNICMACLRACDVCGEWKELKKDGTQTPWTKKMTQCCFARRRVAKQIQTKQIYRVVPHASSKWICRVIRTLYRYVLNVVTFRDHTQHPKMHLGR